jgi:hypothetical protein
MAQISRPFQIALVAMVLLAAVWMLALRGHRSATSGSSAPVPASTQAATPSPIYHGSAPGVEGLSRAISKAHGAVTTSQQNAKALEQKSAQASGGTNSATGSSAAKASPAPSAAAAPKAVAVAPKTVVAPKAKVAPKAAPKSASKQAPRPSMQPAVEAELKQGKIVTILFWNPKATDDAAVHRELQSVGGKLHSSVAVHYALANQVGSFGTITSGVQVYGTPTLLIVNKHGRAQSLTGLPDAYAIEQAIGEAQHA